MRLTTWNVNGIRNPFSYHPWSITKTFPAMFDILEADIIVMQELKIQRKDLRDDMVILDGWDCYFSLPRQKKGYSGVGIYTRNATCSPIRAEEGILGVLTPPNSTTQFRSLPESQQIGGYLSELELAELGVDPLLLDAEGRCVILEFPAFVLFGVYSPANSNGLRDDFRYAFLNALDCRIRKLDKMGKRVVLVGDLNVSRGLNDTASAAEDIKKAGMTPEEYVSTPNRRIFNQLIINGEVYGERDEGREQPILLDTTREFHPERKGMYTHWEQKINARPGNFGSRIDFVLASGSMRDWFVHADIQEGLMGSDHCPVYGEFKDVVSIEGDDGRSEVSLIDMMNPPGVFNNGVRQKEWNIKELPSFSARLMPEFYQRRSIKDMFKKPTAPAAPTTTASSSSGQTGSASTSKSIQSTNANSALDETAGASSTNVVISPSPERKRKASETSTTQSSKKQKPTPSSTSKTAPAKGQKSLKGFFQAKPKPEEQSNGSNEDVPAARETTVSKYAQETVGDTTASEAAYASSTPPSISTKDFTPSIDVRGSLVASDTPAKSSWQTLFRKPAAPLCESHEEPCKSMQTKKKGENQGRSFWMCARPLGPSGNKEKGTQWRCPTFIWCSDFKGGEIK
ncbi:APN2 DNA lyase apurinic/apyrimidinic [Aureobasidium melanogenum CBS 110374]|uniref:DNA-(apurinic or apyrimidinic site) endonuclease 2 n=1 Tax=Aureobasidium melanogenum (strain CBS 110374) TaxID=1043003 RepID=A0A074W9G7_AURM1|nr:APN2 DNA lyase apurinic/apyrimidinic [Aureobasidium melanogenum CBS 110374]KEQ66557.1 APN2 DNA lyase apurinic/apyrimidinic [Aureobasidium melanogenum CBS 110374]